ncbi:MAG: amino acid permease [Saprospirales bacterium]|nr:MAG: amino acid permease [Saprospirales bacterium]
MAEGKPELKRGIGLSGAVLMGLGSIIGTGIFVSIAIGTQIAGNGIVIAIFIAGVLAIFNGLSSAQLAAAHSVSGGTYEYGYRFLNSYLGFTAGWMFLIAKSASAATAVLGCIGYLFYALGIGGDQRTIIISGLILLFGVGYLVSGGISRSNLANKIIVGITLVGLLSLLIVAFGSNGLPLEVIFKASTDVSINKILYASALMFVAYTGYGRIATLGEEVKNPKKIIPKAIITAMGLIVLLYLLVTLAAIQVMGAEEFGNTIDGEAAPLVKVAEVLNVPLIQNIVALAAITAMLGVLLNLILGLSRVMLSMARRGDIPKSVANIRSKDQSPVRAVWITTVIIALLVLSGDVVFTWSFSAFTVLIYYSITNLAALYLPSGKRLYPKWIAFAGMISCIFLAFWVDPVVWMLGLGLIVAGLIWHFLATKFYKKN